MNVVLSTNNTVYSKKVPVFTSKTMDSKKRYSQKLENNSVTENNLSNLRALADRFANEGLTYDECRNAVRKNLFMLCQKPETLEHNIRGTVEKLGQYGLTTSSYLRCAKIHPSLFSRSPETIYKNIMEINRLYGEVGLTPERYILAATKNPNIFEITPQSLRKKINRITEESNTSNREICEMLLKNPRAFQLSENKIIKNYKILEYIEMNKAFDSTGIVPCADSLRQIVLNKNISNSSDLNFLILLRNKISNNLPRGHKIREKNIRVNIAEYIQKNKNKIHQIDVLESEFAKEFAKVVRDFSKSIIGKNIFRVNVIKI